MATQITNKATLNFSSGADVKEVASNTATVTMQGPLEISKRALEDAYFLNDELVYTVVVKNTSSSPLTNVVIKDNLGTFLTYTPLTYIGPTHEYINDVYTASLTPVISAAGDSVEHTIASLNANSTLMLHYKVKTNEYAPATVGASTITNTVTATADNVNNPVTATHTIPVASYADVKIEKMMHPDPVVDGSALTYTFKIDNYGTIDATNVTLSDIFDPRPVITLVTADGTVVPGTDYSYANGDFLYPSATSAVDYKIPAATFTTDPVTGIISVVPGSSIVTIQGTI